MVSVLGWTSFFFLFSFVQQIATDAGSALGYNLTAQTATVQPVTVSDGSTAYKPPEYTPTVYVTGMHKAPRLDSNYKTFPTDINDTDGMIKYASGIGIAGAFFVFMVVFSLLFFPFCYCFCCRNSKSRKPSFFSFAVILALFCIVIGLAGGFVGLQSDAAMQSALKNLAGAVTDVQTTIDTMDTKLAAAKTALNDTISYLTPHIGCDMVNELKTGFDDANSKISMPIPADVKTQLADINNLVSQIADPVSMATKGFCALLLLLISIFALYTIQARAQCMKFCNSPRKGITCLAAPISMIILIVVWLLATVSIIISVVFADFCITPPVERLTNLLKTQMNTMDEKAIVEFFFQCSGTPPAMLADLFAQVSKFSQLKDSADGIAYLVNKNPGACATANITQLGAKLTTIITPVGDVVSLLRCETVNRPMELLLSQAICTNFQTASVNLWVGLFLSGLFLTVAMFNYAKTSRSLAKVAPKSEVPVAEMAPLTA